MNLPNKLTMLRIIMSFVIIAVLLFPFDAMGVENPPRFWQDGHKRWERMQVIVHFDG